MSDVDRLKGSMPPLVTPFVRGEVDYDEYARLVEFHIAGGTDALVAVGTTGESATLSEAEHTQVIRDVIRLVAGRVPVIAGTGGNSTVEALRLTRAAKEAGADACLLVTPYYNKPTQEGLFQHYKTVAEARPGIREKVEAREKYEKENDRELALYRRLKEKFEGTTP